MKRRAFIRNGTLTLLAPAAARATRPYIPPQHIGLVTDLHYADKPARGSRHYRESLDKLAVAAAQYARKPQSFIVELGDLIDAAPSAEQELAWLKTINTAFAKIPGDKHYVLGNHCLETLSKKTFLNTVGQAKSYYAFDSGQHRYLVLDACFRADGTAYDRGNFTWTDTAIPPEELEWLKKELAATNRKCIAFVHQRLDVKSSHGIHNAEAVRDILEASGKVLAVFQGHNHKNEHQLIGNIHYCTLRAMVEGSGAANSGFSSLEVGSDHSIKVHGFKKQSNYTWS